MLHGAHREQRRAPLRGVDGKIRAKFPLAPIVLLMIEPYCHLGVALAVLSAPLHFASALKLLVFELGFELCRLRRGLRVHERALALVARSLVSRTQTHAERLAPRGRGKLAFPCVLTRF